MLRLALPSRHLLLRTASLLLVPILGGTVAAPAQKVKGHHVPKQVKQQIADLEEQWKTATLNGDVALMDRLLSDDYVGISWTGQVNTKDMQLDRVRNHALQVSSLELSDATVKVLGSVAIVTSLADVKGTNDNARMDGSFRYTRIYQRLPSGIWKITNFEATRIPQPGGRGNRRPPPPDKPPPPAY